MWQPITVDKLLAYMGFMILMGIVKLPWTEDYWEKDDIYYYNQSINQSPLCLVWHVGPYITEVNKT